MQLLPCPFCLLTLQEYPVVLFHLQYPCGLDSNLLRGKSIVLGRVNNSVRTMSASSEAVQSAASLRSPVEFPETR